MSEVLPVSEEQAVDQRLLPVHDTRQWQLRLAKGLLDEATIMNCFPVGGLVTWAPTESAALGRLLASLLKIPAEAFAGRPLRLVVPMDVFPGCSTVSAIKGLFWHPFLGISGPP